MELAVVRRHPSDFRFRVYNGREWAESIGDNHTRVLRIHHSLTLNIIINYYISIIGRRQRRHQ